MKKPATSQPKEREVRWTSQFKSDFKRVRKQPRHREDVEELLQEAVDLLAKDKALPAVKRDHALSGNWSDHRECHLKPDLLLIYRLSGRELQLVRIGSHSDLGL